MSADAAVRGPDARDEPLAPGVIEAWVTALSRRWEDLGSRGICYQTLVVPDAPLVHRDLVADADRPPGRSLFAPVCDALDDVARAQCVHPVAELREAQVRHETYDLRDGSWTDWGAWIGYRASVAALAGSFPSVRILDESDVVWSERPAGADDEPGDGAGLAPAVTVLSPQARVVSSTSTEDGDTCLVLEQDAPALPSAVVFRDSLMDPAARLFAESFRRTTFVTTPNVLHRDLVAREQPDIVIHELAEHRLVIAPDAPTAPDFRATFGDLLLEDGPAQAAQRRSRSLARAGRFEEAIAASDDVLALVPPTARLLLHRARLHLETGQVGAALEAVRHAVTLDPADGAVWALLGQVLARLPGREIEVAAALARAARVEPAQPAFWQQAISAALRADDLRLAEELRRDALSRHVDDANLANAASWVLAATGRLEEAEEAVGQAVRIQPDTVEHLWQLASIQIRRGRLADAAVTMARLDQLRPDDPDVRHYRDVLERATTAKPSNLGGHDEGQR